MPSPSNKTATGPHAKDVVRRYFKHSVHPASGPFLQWLEQNDLIIVPRPYNKPARRGNAADLGPMIGKSHTASLVENSR